MFWRGFCADTCIIIVILMLNIFCLFLSTYYVIHIILCYNSSYNNFHETLCYVILEHLLCVWCRVRPVFSCYSNHGNSFLRGEMDGLVDLAKVLKAVLLKNYTSTFLHTFTRLAAPVMTVPTRFTKCTNSA